MQSSSDSQQTTANQQPLTAYRPPRRISVIGASGSGKTTIAREISKRLGIPHVELDALHWEPNWTEVSDEAFRERVQAALANEAWVVDGNYSKVRDLIWSRADVVVWLDYTLPLLLWRIVSRTLRRSFTREELWSGNRESLRTAFFSRDSIILWVLTTYRKRRIEYSAIFARPQDQSFRIVRLHTPQAAKRWLKRLK